VEAVEDPPYASEWGQDNQDAAIEGQEGIEEESKERSFSDFVDSEQVQEGD